MQITTICKVELDAFEGKPPSLPVLRKALRELYFVKEDEVLEKRLAIAAGAAIGQKAIELYLRGMTLIMNAVWDHARHSKVCAYHRNMTPVFCEGVDEILDDFMSRVEQCAAFRKDALVAHTTMLLGGLSAAGVLALLPALPAWTHSCGTAKTPDKLHRSVTLPHSEDDDSAFSFQSELWCLGDVADGLLQEAVLFEEAYSKEEPLYGIWEFDINRSISIDKAKADSERTHKQLAATMAELQQEMQRVHLARLVDTHLAAIKAHLWRPQGPLMQQRLREFDAPGAQRSQLNSGPRRSKRLLAMPSQPAKKQC